MQGYKALTSYAVSIAEITSAYLKKTEDFLSSHSRMQSPIEISVNGRANMFASPIEIMVHHQTHNLQTPINGHYPPANGKVFPYIPPHGSSYSRKTGVYKGMHRNYTPKPRRKRGPVEITNINRRDENKVTVRMIPFVKPPKKRV